MSSPARRSADRARAKAQPWRRWYSTVRWKRRRAKQLHRIPWCEPCRSLGRRTPATVANHVIPHRGDPRLFWYGELESCCAPCHDAAIQKAEARGFRTNVSDDGWPIDPAHPFNRPRSKR